MSGPCQASWPPACRVNRTLSTTTYVFRTCTAERCSNSISWRSVDVSQSGTILILYYPFLASSQQIDRDMCVWLGELLAQSHLECLSLSYKPSSTPKFLFPFPPPLSFVLNHRSDPPRIFLPTLIPRRIFLELLSHRISDISTCLPLYKSRLPGQPPSTDTTTSPCTNAI